MDYINLFSRLETPITGDHWTHCALHHWISAEVIFNALCNTINLNSLKTHNFN